MTVRTLLTRIVLTTLIAFAPVAASAQAGPSDMIKSRNAALMAAINAKDAVKVAAMYTADAEVTQPGDRARTRDGVQRMWEKLFAKGLTSFAVTPADVDFANSVVTEKGTYLLKNKSGASMGQGSYVTTWKKDGAQWKIATTEWAPAK
jgi:uncharacterized protein (TIGR02246 family)